MPQFPPVPHEVVAQARARLFHEGIDARPVFVIGPDRENGQVEFFTASGLVWPVVMRLGADGVVTASADIDPPPEAVPLAKALDRLVELLGSATPHEPAPEPAE